MDIKTPGLPKLPVVEEERSGKLTDNESSFILDAELSKKRRNDPIILAFIDSFVRHKNIKQASRDAGVSNAEGYRIRHYVDVAQAISKIIDRSAIKYGFDASEIMERNKEIVDFDPISLVNPDGSFRKMHEIEPEDRRVIKKLKVKNIFKDIEDINGMKQTVWTGEIIEYEFYDKQKSIELAGKEKELFKNTIKHEHDVTKNMADVLLASAQRGKETSIAYQNVKTVETTAEVVEVKNDEDY